MPVFDKHKRIHIPQHFIGENCALWDLLTENQIPSYNPDPKA